MALRRADEVGVPDVRRFAGLQVTDASPPALDAPVVKAPRPRAPRPRQPALASVPVDAADRAPSAPGLMSRAQPPQAARERPLLGDEELVYLQVSVPEVALQRVKVVSFELALDHPHLRRHQTVLGALVWEHVDHTDQGKLEALADLLDAYRTCTWHGQPEVRRLSARMPLSLKRRVEGAVLALSQTQREVSAKMLVAALVWRHVSADDEAAFGRLVAALGGYQQELSRRSVGAPVARVPRDA